MGRDVRRPLARSTSPARWDEYRRLLEGALAAGYRIVSPRRWLAGEAGDTPQIVLRHDVDQAARSALAMAAVEAALGVRSVWYFRWRTADPRVIARLRAAGCEVGLHYETLTRMALDGRMVATADGDPQPAALADARRTLRRELYAFRTLFGAGSTACPHGDSRVPKILNGRLLAGEDLPAYGLDYDGNLAFHGRSLGAWLTDRARPDGGWAGRLDPHELLAQGTSPILAVIHPNNWCAGAALWTDRAARAALPRGRGRRRVARLTGAPGDEPPW